jgi:large subunit ribosomal protein L18e
MSGKENKIGVVVGKITDDVRIVDIPKITVAALKCTRTARQRIKDHGGEVITFDELAKRSPKGSDTVLMRGPQSREAKKHFGMGPYKHAKYVLISFITFDEVVCEDSLTVR